MVVGKEDSNQNKTEVQGTGSSSSHAVTGYFILSSHDLFACLCSAGTFT